MVPRLWVPLIHSLLARNWNWAACGAALTASRVAKRVAVSTPLRVDRTTGVVMSGFPSVCGVAQNARGWTDGSGAGELAVAEHRALGCLGCFGVDGDAELFLQGDELGHRRVAGQGQRQLRRRPPLGARAHHAMPRTSHRRAD